MSGYNKWSKIKQKKGVSDAKGVNIPKDDVWHVYHNLEMTEHLAQAI